MYFGGGDEQFFEQDTLYRRMQDTYRLFILPHGNETVDNETAGCLVPTGNPLEQRKERVPRSLTQEIIAPSC